MSRHLEVHVPQGKRVLKWTILALHQLFIGCEQAISVKGLPVPYHGH
jgi:hypothetical protein